MRFSERSGYVAPRLEHQDESMDEALRGDLWNTVLDWCFGQGPLLSGIPQTVWRGFLHQPRDLYNHNETRDHARRLMIDGEWHQAYDLLEFITKKAHARVTEYPPGDLMFNRDAQEFLDKINAVLGSNRAGWHVVAGYVVPMDSATGIAEIEQAVAGVQGRPGATRALDKAIELFADRKGSHPNNVAAEAVNAVEAVACEIVKSQGPKVHTLGEALNKMTVPQQRNLLLMGWSKFYGFASTTFRHGGPSDPQITDAEAQFFLASAAAFINLLLTYDTHNAAANVAPTTDSPPATETSVTS